MPEVHNINRISDEFVDNPGFRSDLKTEMLGTMAGSEKLYFNIDHVKPGAKSVKYHSHSIQEEFFLVLKGRGTLRLNGKSIPVREGDFFAKPGGKEISHQFINDSDEVLRILDCGTVEKGDIVSYPDEDVILIKKDRSVFRNTDKVENWTSEPNN